MMYDSLICQAAALNCLISTNTTNTKSSTFTMSNALQDSVDIASLPRNSSDSHIARLNAQKNQSKLFLIKSYSFIDKSLRNHALPRKPKQPTENVARFRQVDALLLDAAPEKPQANAKNLDKINAKVKKCKANKTDSDDDLRALLRHPSVIMEGVVSEVQVRPKSMPSTAMTTTRKPPDPAAPPPPTETSNKSKQNDFKRESFLRHSLQSIRRSFSAHKKFAGFGHNDTNSNATTKSARTQATKTCSSSSSSSATSTSSNSSSTTSTASAASAAPRQSRSNGKAYNKSEKVDITVTLNDNTAHWAERKGEIGNCDIGDVGSQRKLRVNEKELCRR